MESTTMESTAEQTVQQRLIEYGNELKARSNGMLAKRLAQEIIGQAVVEGICFIRTPVSRTICDVRRDGNIIRVTETVVSTVNEVVDGRLVGHEARKTNEVLSIHVK